MRVGGGKIKAEAGAWCCPGLERYDFEAQGGADGWERLMGNGRLR